MTHDAVAALGLARIHSEIDGAVDPDEPLAAFADDCRAAGVALAA